MKVAYWPGCVSRGFTPELHGSMAQVAPLLDIELVELDRAACCGAGVIAEHNQELADTLNARTFALAQQEIADGAELMMNICSTCQGAQSECQERLDANTPYRDARQRDARRGGPRRTSAASPTSTSCGCWSRRSASTSWQARVKRPLHGPARRPVLRLLHRAPDADRLGIDARAPARHVPAAADRGARRHGRRLRRPVQVLRLPDHHDEQGGVAAAGRPPPRRRDRRRAPTASSRRARCATSTSTCSSRSPSAASAGRWTCRCCTCRSSSASRSASSRRSSACSKHVVKPTSVIDWSTSVVAGAPA